MPEPMQRDTNGNTFLAAAAVMLRRWKTVLVVTLLTAVAAVAAAVMGPDSYVTGTTLVPFSRSQPGSGMALAALPPGVANLVGVGGASSATDRLVGVILRSQTLGDSMVARLVPRFATEAELRETLDKRTRVQRSPEGSVTIEVRARDPQLAARVANTFPVLLNDLMARLSAEGAVRRQRLLEAQLVVARERLLQSEQRLLAFQRRRSAPNVDEQARRTLEAAAALHQQVLAQEREVAELRRTLVPGHPQLRAAEADLQAVRGQLGRVAQGSGPAFVPLGEGGELKVASSRLEREFAQDQQIYQSLTAALAEAQLDAHDNLPVLTVLDEARVPGPAGSLPQTALLGAVFGLVLGLVLAFALEALHRARTNPENAGFFSAWSQFRRDLRLGGGRGREVAHGD